MRYLLLIYDEPAAEVTPEKMAAVNAEYADYTRWLRDTGAFQAGEALQPVQTATTVRVRDGDLITTDGPFAETKEHLGGFYLVEARDLDEAIEMGRRLPAAKWGSVEIRPIWELPPDYQEAAGATAGATG